MRAHVLQHVSFEGPGSIEPWLRRCGYDMTQTSFFSESPMLPEPESLDLLIVMGGPMSVHDTAAYPWLVDEKTFIRRVIEAGKSVLGICLGAQLIAAAMGAGVRRNHQKEIGWFPVYGVPASEGALFTFPLETTVFHWHGETFDLPPGAVQLARSAACENQAFQLGPSVMGLQFHLETTPETLADLVAHCRHELVASAYVQNEEDILATGPGHFKTINRLMEQVLSYLTGSA